MKDCGCGWHRAREGDSVTQTASLTGAVNPLRQKWNALSRRERLGLVAAGVALGLLVLWTLALRPAWDRWQSLEPRRQAAMARWHQMQGLAAEAQRLKAQAPAGADARAGSAGGRGPDLPTREALVKALGPGATMEAEGSQLTLRFSEATAEGIRQVLVLARSRIAATVTEAELEPTTGGLKGRLRLQWASS